MRSVPDLKKSSEIFYLRVWVVGVSGRVKIGGGVVGVGPSL